MDQITLSDYSNEYALTENKKKSYASENEYRKSNLLISSKYKASLLENKIMSISLSKALSFKEEDGAIVSTLYASELKDLLGGNTGSFYHQLDTVAREMTGRTIGITNPEKKTFDYIAIVTRASYSDGEFRIEYNKHLKDYIAYISSSFTPLSLSTMLSFENVYSFRLYELLKSKSYYPGNSGFENKNYIFTITMDLAELRFAMGVANAELSDVKRILLTSRFPDYEKALEVSPEKIYTRWDNFKTRVLDIAVKEINDKDMIVSYKPIKGQNRKVKKIEFTVQLINKAENGVNKSLLDEIAKQRIIEKVSELIEQPIKLKGIKDICEAADYDLDLLTECNSIMQNKIDSVEDKVSYFIGIIKNKKDKKTEMKLKPVKGKVTISNSGFLQQTYDFDELRRLIDPVFQL